MTAHSEKLTFERNTSLILGALSAAGKCIGMTQPVENTDSKQATVRAGRVALIIPTFNAAQLWTALLEGIRAQSLKPDQVIVIDSSSSDGTADLARKEGFTVFEIPQREFNHGGTRQMGADLAETPTS